MRSVLTGIALMIAIAVIAWGISETQPNQTKDRATSQFGSVRLDD